MTRNCICGLLQKRQPCHCLFMALSPPKLPVFVFLKDYIPAALTVRCVPVMIPKAALRAGNILLRCDEYPLPYKTAHLPGDQNNPREDHQYRYHAPRLRKRNNITEPDRCKGDHRKIKGVAEILDRGVDRTFNGIEEA